MGIAKMSLYGNDYIGAFAISNDSFTIVGGSPKQSGRSMIEENLKTKIVETLINGSDLVGIYCATNSNHILIPEMVYKSEIECLDSQLNDVTVSILGSDLNALRNNILANDKIALINPNYSNVCKLESCSGRACKETVRVCHGAEAYAHRAEVCCGLRDVMEDLLERLLLCLRDLVVEDYSLVGEDVVSANSLESAYRHLYDLDIENT